MQSLASFHHAIQTLPRAVRKLDESIVNQIRPLPVPVPCENHSIWADIMVEKRGGRCLLFPVKSSAGTLFPDVCQNRPFGTGRFKITIRFRPARRSFQFHSIDGSRSEGQQQHHLYLSACPSIPPGRQAWAPLFGAAEPGYT